MKELTFNDRAKGAFYGFAIGDAMGATTEFMTKQDIEKKFGPGGLHEIVGGGWLNLEPGQVTDDTQMMLCVANAIKATKGYGLHMGEAVTGFLDKCAENFVAWYSKGPVDVGNQCAKVIGYFAHSKPCFEWNIDWLLCPCNNNNAKGNGGLMRALPAALFADYRASMLQASLTHNSVSSTMMVMLYQDMMQQILRGRSKHEVVNRFLTVVKHMSFMEPTGHVENTLNNAVYWFLTTNSLEECVVGCVNDGGDADTIAAIAGSLAGAFYGYDNIPARHIKALEKGVRRELDGAVKTVCKFAK